MSQQTQCPKHEPGVFFYFLYPCIKPAVASLIKETFKAMNVAA